MSVTVPRVPLVVENVTVWPLNDVLFPATSLAWSVTVDVETPSATIEAGLADNVESSAVPGSSGPSFCTWVKLTG